MSAYLRYILISLIATLAMGVPLLVYHRLPWREVGEIAGAMTVAGPFAVWGYTSRARWSGEVSEEWRCYFAMFPATFSVILQAIIVSATKYWDFGTLVPVTIDHVIVDLAGIFAFGLSMWLPSQLTRKNGIPIPESYVPRCRHATFVEQGPGTPEMKAERPKD